MTGRQKKPAPENVEPIKVNPSMIRLARGAHPMTQAELSDALKVPQNRISRWEDGLTCPSSDDVDRLADLFQYHRDFFYQSDQVFGFGTCCLYHRKRKSLPVRTLSTIHDRINVLRIGVARLLKCVQELPVNFDRMDVEDYRGPESVANLVRGMWQMPFGPVKNLVGVVEAAGGIVVQCSFGTDQLDAVSQWPPGMPPLFFLNKDSPADRWRFNLAHEVGHMFLHRIPTPNAEEEADRFASEFLMPERDIATDLVGMSLDKALRLKPRWRVSMQALIRKARDTKAITPRRYTSLYVYLSSLGYRKNEPNPLEPEKPTTLERLVNVYKSSFGYQLSEVGRVAFCPSGEHFEKRFFAKEQSLAGEDRNAKSPVLRIFNTDSD